MIFMSTAASVVFPLWLNPLDNLDLGKIFPSLPPDSLLLSDLLVGAVLIFIGLTFPCIRIRSESSSAFLLLTDKLVENTGECTRGGFRVGGGLLFNRPVRSRDMLIIAGLWPETEGFTRSS